MILHIIHIILQKIYEVHSNPCKQDVWVFFYIYLLWRHFDTLKHIFLACVGTHDPGIEEHLKQEHLKI